MSVSGPPRSRSLKDRGVEANPHVASPHAAQQLGAIQEMAVNTSSSLSQAAAFPQGRAWRRNRSKRIN